jgi:hypothetical protein
MFAVSASAQVRSFGAGAFVLDDNHGRTVVLESPQPGDPGYSNWAASSQLIMKLPLPPNNGDNMGFIYPGPSVAGPSEMLVWDAPTSVGGTGGAQGAWRPQSITATLSASGVVAGTGTSGQLAGWTGPGSIGNIDLTGDVTTSGGTQTTIASTGAAGTTAGQHIVAAINSSSTTGTINAANGGTGQSSYVAGDILYASGATAISRLPIGSADQVLSVSGGVPNWTKNGATITSNTASSSISADQTPFTLPLSSTYIRISNTKGSAIVVSGINSAGVSDGREITIANVSTDPSDVIQLNDHDATGGTSSDDQFDLPGQQPVLLGQKGAATFIYDITAHNWELVSTN